MNMNLVIGGQFRPVKGGQFKSARGGQFHRFLQSNGDGTFTSKNGTFPEGDSYTLDELKTVYAGTTVTYIDPVENIQLNSLPDLGDNGIAEYSQDHVAEALRKKKDDDFKQTLKQQTELKAKIIKDVASGKINKVDLSGTHTQTKENDLHYE